MRRAQILVPLAILTVVLGLSPGCPSVTVDPEPGACVPGVTRCSRGAQCDDGDPCTTDTCDAGCCENTPECKTDRQCDDGDQCTTDICDAGCCGSASIDCDDREFCTGTENCDPVSGECISSGNPCDDGQACNGVETCTGEQNQFVCSAGTPIVCPGSAICMEPNGDCPDGCPPLTRTVAISPPNGTLVYGVEDDPPPGWTISNISHDGEFDAANGAVKWFFLDDDPRTLSYTAIPPTGTTGSHCFSGIVNYDGGANVATTQECFQCSQ